MNTSVAVELRNADNVIESPDPLGQAPYVSACTNHFVLLEEISLIRLQELVDQFAATYEKALISHLMRPPAKLGGRVARSKERIKNLQSPLVLSAQFVSTPRKTYLGVYGHFCKTDAIQRATSQAKLVRKRSSTMPDNWIVLDYDLKTQREIASAIVTSTIRTMEWASARSGLHHLASERIYEILRGARSTFEFFSRICATLQQWIRDPNRKGEHRSKDSVRSSRFDRPYVLMWFCMWLSERSFLLFPIDSLQKQSEIYLRIFRPLLAEVLREEERREDSEIYFQKLSKVISKSEEHRSRARVSLDAINLLHPGAAWGRVSAHGLGAIKARFQSRDNARRNIMNSMWSIEAARLKFNNVDSRTIKSLTDQAIYDRLPRGVDLGLWAWVDHADALGENKGYRFNYKYARKDFTAGPNLRAHLGELRQIFPMIAGKSADSTVSKINVWLHFLSSLSDDNVPRRIVDINPHLLASMQSNDVTNLRGFMLSSGIDAHLAAVVFSMIDKAWRMAANECGLGNLISPVSELLKSANEPGKQRNGVSTRRAIDMDILELLIEENRADDFGFSRERSTQAGFTDHRRVLDPGTHDVTKMWWPGLAILMDLLLHIPLRHKQGRYLDSGEGDEYVLDIHSLSLKPNDAPTATRGRNEAFLQKVSLSPVRDEPGLGMRVNTNKTGGPYTFEWLAFDLAENVQRVINWQRKYNPIDEPVSDRGNSEAERQANADVVWVYPIFRDPARNDRGPVSSEIVLAYFRKLLKRVEDKYNLRNGTSLQFFRPNGEPVYDIHALRVTGVTRLIRLGVDPRIVRKLCGHSSLVMTFHYNDVSGQIVSTALEQALEARRPTREKLLGMNREERERFLSHLVSHGGRRDSAFKLLQGLIDERSPFLDIRVDGICPGMKCAAAGVWRPRACALCPFNITGAPFIAGIQVVLNNLMAELSLNLEVMATRRDELYELRKLGKPVRALEAEIAQQDELLDHIIQEWIAQFQYLKRAEADFVMWMEGQRGSVDVEDPVSAMALVSPMPDRLRLVIEEQHHLALFTGLIESAKRVEGFVPSIGVREKRDGMLLEIARHQDRAGLFYRLDPALRKLALDEFASQILDASSNPVEIQGLIEGKVDLTSILGPSRWLDVFAKSGTEEMVLPNSRGARDE